MRATECTKITVIFSPIGLDENNCCVEISRPVVGVMSWKYFSTKE